MTRFTWIFLVLVIGCTFEPGIEYIEVVRDGGPGGYTIEEPRTGVVQTIPLPDAPRTYIFILAGQSNMSGRGLISELPKGYPFHGDRILNFNNAYDLVPAMEPVDSIVGQVDRVSIEGGEAGVGPGLVFADHVAGSLPNDYFVLVPCAKGGSTTLEWAYSENRNSLFGSCIDRTLRAQAQTGGELAGMLWYQGESDSVSPEVATGWASRTQEIWDLFRDTLGDDNLPIVYVRLPVSYHAAYTGWHVTRTEQASLMSVEDKQVWVQAPSMLLSDYTHLTTAGQMILGQQMATVWLSIR